MYMYLIEANVKLEPKTLSVSAFMAVLFLPPPSPPPNIHKVKYVQ